jgi:hypothetical protein
MFSRRESIEIVDKLIELTHHGVIEWEKYSPPSYLVGPDSNVDLVYAVNYLNRTIQIYRRDFKYYLDEIQYTWDYEIVIEFVSNNGERLGRFPNTPNASELLAAIQYQNPEIKNFYKDIFGQKS